VLLVLFIAYGLLATYYFIFKSLPALLMYVLMAPVIVVSPFLIARREVRRGNRFIGYTLYILFGITYAFLLALAIF